MSSLENTNVRSLSTEHLPSYSEILQTTQAPERQTSSSYRGASVPATETRWYSRFNRYLENSWASELAAVVMSAAGFIAIAGILMAFDGHAVPDLPEIINLNAIISILSTISKSLLLYAISAAIGQAKWDWFSQEYRSLMHLQDLDDASRGPLGAATVIFKHRSISASSLGALVILLALAIDPFIQQVIEYTPMPASVSSPDCWVQKVPFPTFFANTSSSTYSDAISGALWTKSNYYKREANCPTENCTWPTFETLEWCYKAETIQNLSEVAVDFDFLVNASMEDEEDFNIYFNDDKIELRVAVYIEYEHPEEDSAYTIEAPVEFIAQIDPRNNITGYAATEPILDLNGAILSMMHVRLPSRATNKVDLHLEYAEIAALTLCKNKYDITMIEGKVESRLLESTYGRMFKPNDTASDTLCWSPDSENFDFTGATTYRNVDGETHFISDNSTMAFCTHDWYWGDDIVSLLSSQEMVTWASESRIEDGNEYSWDSRVKERIRIRKLAGVMETMTASLNQLFRLGSTEKVMGTYIKYETVVKVYWIWLTLPYLIVLLGTLCLLLVIRCGRNASRTWKTSLIAVLYHGLEDEWQGGKTNSSYEMSQIAENTKVKLADLEKGWKLIGS